MLRQNDRNSTMVGRFNSTIEDIITKHTPPGVPKENADTHAAAVKQRFIEANADAEKLTGTKTIAWIAGGCEHTVTWILKDGSIMQIIVKRLEPGLIRVTHEQSFLN